MYEYDDRNGAATPGRQSSMATHESLVSILCSVSWHEASIVDYEHRVNNRT